MTRAQKIAARVAQIIGIEDRVIVGAFMNREGMRDVDASAWFVEIVEAQEREDYTRSVAHVRRTLAAEVAELRREAPGIAKTKVSSMVAFATARVA